MTESETGHKPGRVRKPAGGAEPGKLRGLRTLERGIAVLELLGSAEGALSLSAIASEIGLPVGTTYRILQTLVARGYAERDVRSKWYELGLKVLELRGAMTAGAIRLAADTRPYLKTLSRRSRERTHLAVYRGGNVIYIDRVEPHDDGPYIPLGLQVPAHVTSLGKAILAFMPEPEVNAYAETRLGRRFTPNTIMTDTDLRAELKIIRNRGYATDASEYQLHVACVGAPVFDHTGWPIAAISVAGSPAEVGPRESELAREVMATAEEISLRLGYHARDQFDPQAWGVPS